MRSALIAILLLAVTPNIIANELSVDRRTIRMSENVVITLTLEGSFAALDEVDIPLRNLVVTGPPSVSSEFSWINGDTSRRKTLRYVAQPKSAGGAMVGPLIMVAPDGERDTRPGISIEVVSDIATGSNDPAIILRELLASGRDPIYVVAEADRASAFVGEQVVVTWTLYNGASVQEWQIGKVPKLEDFWTEELDVRSARPVQVQVGEYVLQKLPIRRVALFPLRSGQLQIGGVQVEAAIMRRISSGPFSLFEGSLVETSYTAAPLTIDVKPLPPGIAVDAVGDLAMRCDPPQQKGGGPVSMTVDVSGRGNLRAATVPRFEQSPAGEVQINTGVLTAQRTGTSASMTRRWTFLIFPARTGRLSVPPVTMSVFDPVTATRKQLRCEGASLLVQAASQPRTPPPSPTGQRKPGLTLGRAAPWAGAALLTAILVLAAVPRWQRQLAIRGDVHAVIRAGTPAEIREAVRQALIKRKLDPEALSRETSARGDAFRALRSLIESMERNLVEPAEAEPELRRRLRDLLSSS